MKRLTRFLLVPLLAGFLLTAGCDSTSSNGTSNPPNTVTTLSAAEQTQMVNAHNQVRQTLNLPPLRWSDALGSFAQEWANTLQGQGCGLQHRSNNQFGENLFSGTGASWTPSQVVDAWASEVQFYDYNSNTCQAGQMCGHYTQIVWRATETVGCGKSQCGQTEVWVCNYDPPGNFSGQKPY